MSRPVDIGGMHQVALTPLGHKVARGLEQQGEFFFTSQELLDAFGLAFSTKDTQKAIDALLTFTKELVPLQCHLRDIGFVEIDRAAFIFAFTYTVESKKHDNQPLWIREAFELQIPLLALVNEVASMWFTAFGRRPIRDIHIIARGQ